MVDVNVDGGAGLSGLYSVYFVYGEVANVIRCSQLP